MKLTEKDAIWCKTQKQWNKILVLFPKVDLGHARFKNADKYGYFLIPMEREGKGTCDTKSGIGDNYYTIHKAKDILKKSFKKDVLKRLDKIEKVISDNTVVSKMESTESLKFDLPTKELEEIPENWCVKDNKEVTEWVCKQNPNWGREISDMYFHYHKDKLSLRYGYQEEILQHYTEITFDQFKKWVLKEEEKPLSIREVQVKVSSQEEANECAEIAKACGKEISEDAFKIYNHANYFRREIGENGFGVFSFSKEFKEISIQEFRERFGKTEIDFSKAGQLVVDHGNRTFILTDGTHCGDSFSGVIVGGDLWYKGTNHQDWSKTNFGLCRASITLKNE